MSIKKLATTISSAAITATLVFTNPAMAQQLEGKRVALLTNVTTSPWIAAYNNTVIERLGEKGIEVVNMTAPYDPSLQSQQLDDAVAQGFDLIVVNPINEVAVLPALKRVKEAEVPVILSVQRLPEGNDDLFVALVGHDADGEGRIAARQMAEALKGHSGNVGVIQGNPDQDFTKTVVSAFRDELEKISDLKVAAVEGSSWRPDDAGAAAAQLALRFQGDNALLGVFGIIDAQGLQAVQAFENAGRNVGEDIIVVTSSCDKRGIDAVRNGKIYSTVNLSPSIEGELIAGEIVKFLQGQELDKVTWLDATAVTPENVDEHAESCTY